jgi:hypothetical protein
MTNPWKSHPLYRLRYYLVVLAILSFFFAILQLTTSHWDTPLWAFHLLWTLASVLWSIYDLTRYALKKAENPEHTAEWPVKKIMIGDAVLAVLWTWWYFLEIASAGAYYSSGPFSVYASIIALLYA